MVLWNAFIHRRQIYADFELPRCLRFITHFWFQIYLLLTRFPVLFSISSSLSSMRFKREAFGPSSCAT